MKLHLPTTWTSQKISALLLLTLTNTYQANAGQNFKTCLAYENDNFTYNNLLKFRFSFSNNTITSSEIVNLCCDASQCSLQGLNCSSVSKAFYCNKVGQTVFCDGLCGGIVGNTSVTKNTTFGNCPQIDEVATYLINTPTSIISYYNIRGFYF
jgi:hypothetical protein